MSYSNYPSAGNTPENYQQPKDNRKVIYGILIAALLLTWGYIWYDKSKSKEQISQLQTQYSNVDSARNIVQQEYNTALARMDSLTGSNTQLTGALAERKTEIDKLKAQIKSELGRKDADLGKARKMIGELNGKVNDLLAQVEQLKTENKTLTASNQQLTVERDTLSAQKQQISQTLTTAQEENTRVTDLASTLHASNINITGIQLKGDGKEKVTDKAKKADVLRISFDLDENRVAPSGSKELYLVVTGPDGNQVTVPSSGGTFTTRDAGDKVYTSKITADYQQGVRTPVKFDWKQDGRYQTGDYKIEIYHNGYKIGEGTKTLKKGGLFG